MKGTKLLTLTATLLLLAGAVRAQTPIDWQTAKIGNHAYGSPSFADNTGWGGDIEMTAGGSDIWGGWDGYYYAYTSVTGLFWNATMQVKELAGPDNWTKCELMVHQKPIPSGDFWRMANWPFISAMTTRSDSGAANVVNAQYRPVKERDCYSTDFSPVMRPSYPNVWLRIERRGPIFTVLAGTDGQTWQKCNDFDTSQTANNFDGTYWSEDLYLGIAVTAHKDTATDFATAKINNFKIEQTTIPTPPTVIGMTVTPTNTTTYEGCEASFYFNTTNNAVPLLPASYTSYQWYKNGTAMPGATGNNLTFLATLADKGAQFYCQATCYSATLTSPTVTLSDVLPATIYTGALKQEIFWGATSLGQVEGGAVGAGSVSALTSFEAPVNWADSYVRRVSGFFIPKVSGQYAFFICSDDDSDLFLSTSANPADKKLIAQQTGWADSRKWNSGGTVDQKRSDRWSPDGGLTVPYASGIDLIANQSYYIEAVHHEGTGGDNLAVTYRVLSDPSSTDPLDGDAPLICAASNNLALMTWPPTGLAWTLQPTNTTVFEGQTATFRAAATVNSEFPVIYQWYRNNSPIAGATASSYALMTSAVDKGAQFKVVASVGFGSFGITSAPVTLNVDSAVFEPGWVKLEMWSGLENKAAVANGTAGDPTYAVAINAFGVTANVADRYTRRISGFFVPTNAPDYPGGKTTHYSFYVSSDDDSDLYLSTNSLPSGKQMIAQQTGSSGLWQYIGDPNGNLAQSQAKCSDSFNGGVYGGGIELTNGAQYYMEVIHHEGTGEDHVETTCRSSWDWTVTVTNGLNSFITGKAIGMNAVRCNWVNFTQQPKSVTGALYSSATFTAQGSTDSTQPVSGTGVTVTNNYVIYQWMKNGVDIPGATASSYTTPMILPGDVSAQYACKIRALGYGTGTGPSFVPVWSNSVVANLTIASVYEPGFARVEFWDNTINPSTATIEAGNAGTPTYVTTTPRFEADIAGGADTAARNNYGRRVSGFFAPPSDGDYVFYMTGDDNADLFLSTDNNPANKQLIAQQIGWGNAALSWQTDSAGGIPSQRHSDTWTNSSGVAPYASGIHLVASQKYYLEAVQHEGGGGDYVAVTFTKYGDPAPANNSDSAIVGNVLGFYAPKCSWVNFTQQPQSLTVTSYMSATFTAQATTDAALSIGSTRDPVTNIFVMYQWQKNGVDIPGATASSYTYPTVLPTDTGAQFTCKVRALGYADAQSNPIWSNSQPAVLTAAPDTIAPTLVSATRSFTNDSQVILIFSEGLNPASANNAANYLISNGVTVSAAVLQADGKTVVLTTSPIAKGSSYTLSITGISDLSLNPATTQVALGIQRGVLFIATDNNPMTLNASDSLIISRLQSRGFYVQAVVASADDVSMATGKDLVFVSATISSGQVAGTYKNVAVPVICCEQAIQDDMAMTTVTGTTDRGTTDNLTTLEIVDPSHPLAAGLSGTVTVATAPSTFAWGQANANAAKVARIVGTTLNFGLYGYEKGALLTDGTAAAERRVTLFTTDNTMVNLNDNGLKLFDAAVDWAQHLGVVPSRLSATISGGNLVISWSPIGGRLQSCTALGGSWTDVGTANPATISLQGNTAQFFRVVNP